MKTLNKSAFIASLALLSYTGFATAQAVSFDNPGDLSKLVNDLKFPGHGGPGGGQFPNPVPSHQDGGFGHQDHGNNGWDHNGPGHHDGPGPQPGPWHPQPGPQPGPWGPQPGPRHPQPGPQPGPWGPQPDPWHPQPGPQPGPGQWHPHHDGHPDWDHNDWNNDQWNHHGPDHNGWWNNYDAWWASNAHPYSMYRTVCTVVPGVSAKGFIVEQTMPFNAKATFYYYNAYDTIIGASNPANGVYAGGNGTPVFDFYQVPQQADHCFLAITQ